MLGGVVSQTISSADLSDNCDRHEYDNCGWGAPVLSLSLRNTNIQLCMHAEPVACPWLHSVLDRAFAIEESRLYVARVASSQNSLGIPESKASSTRAQR